MSEYVCELEDASYEMDWTPKEEVVRCRDCKRFDSKTDGCWWFSHYEQQGNYSWAEVPSDVEPDGFCAWAKRKDGGE